MDAENKVLLVTNIPNPYRVPLLNRLARELERAGCRFRVIFGCRGYARRGWSIDASEFEFSYKVLSEEPLAAGSSETPVILYSGLWRELESFKPDVVVVAGFSFAALQVALWTRRRGRDFLIWSGSTAYGNRSASRVRRLIRWFVVRAASGGIAYGSLSKDYLVQLGMSEESVTIAINTVDVSQISNAVRRARKPLPEDERRVLTFVGALTPRKNPLRLLELVELLSKERDDFVLEIVGDGPESENLKAFAAERGIAKLVSFCGHQEYGRVPDFLSRSYCFLYQTEFDIWGLALVEAMAAELPCLCSVHAGAAEDLIEHGTTGFVVDFADVEAAAESVRFLLDNPAEAAQIGRRAAEFVRKNASIEKSAHGFVTSILNTVPSMQQHGN